MTRPDLAEVHDVLKQQNCLIVHFSGCPKGVGKERNNRLFPNDLVAVIEGEANNGLSCSTVKPGDIFEGMRRNAMGNIGVIVAPRCGESIENACHEDCGSCEDEEGNRKAIPQEYIDKAYLEYTIVYRKDGSHNEWVVKDFDVIGIFVIPPLEISKEVTVSCENPDYSTSTISPVQISMDDVIRTFPNQTFYTFHNSDICIIKNGKCSPIPITTIYA